MFTFLFIVCLSATFSNGIPLEKPANLASYFSQRIIGGVDAPEAYAPHMVALVGGQYFTTVGCGGSIISPKAVLTAAHCITFYVKDGRFTKNFHGRVGSNQWKSGGTKVIFSGYNIHPKYDAYYLKHDAGVLFLKEKLSFNDKVGVIALDYDWVHGGEEMFVTGWGVTGPRFEDDVVHLAPTPDDLQLVYVTTVTHEQCSEAIRHASSQLGWAPPVYRDVEICTLHSQGHGMCNGDSGSALVSLRNGRQTGIVSWGFPCARGVPDVFVRVSGVRDYLEMVLEKLET